jgi:hypothetical protein
LSTGIGQSSCRYSDDEVYVFVAPDSISSPENNRLGFFTVYDGSVEKYIQDFAEKNSAPFDLIFPNLIGAPPTPVAKNAQAFLQWALENTYPPIGFYSAYPGLSVLDIRALMADKSQSATAG